MRAGRLRRVPKSVGQSGSACLGRGCPARSTVLGGALLTLANCLSTTVSITLSTIPVEAPDCHSGVGWPSVDHVAIYPHESGTAPHFLALPVTARVPKSVGQSGSACLGRGCPVRSTVLGGIVDACELLVDHRVGNPLYDPGRGTRLPQRCRLAVCGSCGHISARIRHCPTLFGTPLFRCRPRIRQRQRHVSSTW